MVQLSQIHEPCRGTRVISGRVRGKAKQSQTKHRQQKCISKQAAITNTVHCALAGLDWVWVWDLV